MLLAVYGTLKTGFGNNRFLEGAEFLGTFLTLPQYTMYSMGGFPAITKDGKTAIHVEIWKVTNPQQLKNINRLEGFTGVINHPDNWYDQTIIETPFGAAHMFYFKRILNNPIIKTGKW